jgi:hypothetical protein
MFLVLDLIRSQRSFVAETEHMVNKIPFVIDAQSRLAETL